MNYKEAISYIEEANKYGSVLGLRIITELMNRLGNPQNEQNYVQVAGTNGKGSVITYIDSILRMSGYKIGKYMTPAVFQYREEFQINGKMIEEVEYARLMTRIAKVSDEMEADGLPHPTSFEMETALAFLYFAEKECDLVLLETGMGGATDATNIVKNTVCSVITSISLDHMKFLGDTVEDIAEVKAGIIKQFSDVVISDQKKSVLKIVEKKAKEMHTNFHVAQADENIKVSMLGAYQKNNSATARKVVEVLIDKGYKGIVRDTVDCIEEGLKNGFIPGRFEKISDNPIIIIDGAHNPGAVQMLKETIELHFTNKKVTYIMGVLSDKDYTTEAKMMFDKNSRIITVSTSGLRGLSADKLEIILRKYSDNVIAADNIADAIDLAKADVIKGVADVIVAFGSLSYLGELKRVVKEECHDNWK